MNGTKISKSFFFKMIEQRLNTITKEVEEMKAEAEKEIPFSVRTAKENILFGKLIELSYINEYAKDIDYWKYTELDEKIKAVRDSI